MSNNSIEKILQQLNGTINDMAFEIYKYQISDVVDYAKVWHEPKPNHIEKSCLFFIKDNNSYVGAVHILEDDLHWYVLEKERKKGHLTKALKTAILPFLFKKLKLEKIILQIVSDYLVDAVASAKVAKSVGFKSANGIDYYLYKDQFDFSSSKLSIKYLGMDDKEVDKLKNEINVISKRLEQIHTKIEFSTGLVMSKYQKPTLKEIAVTINARKWSIDDMYHDFLMSVKN